jgi:hypothetical protein
VDNVQAESSSLGSLIPLGLQENAEMLENKEVKNKNPLKDITRLQFSGGGNMYSMTVSRKTALDENWNSNWNAGLKTGGPLKFKGALFGIGPQTEYKPIIEYKHDFTSSSENSGKNSTDIVINLGDENAGDEFVLEMYSDPTYGSIIFKTVAGQSSCPHEVNIAKVLDPRISFSTLPSPYVMPDQGINFDVEVSNLGVGTGKFILAVNENSNEKGLALSFYNLPFLLSTKEMLKKTITVKRGPSAFIYPPIDVEVRPACFPVADPKISWNVPFYASKVTLANIQNSDGTSFIKFLEPLPGVEWAGELKRDNSFSVNTISGIKEKLSILIRNPNFNKGKLKEMERLQSVRLLYRRIGDRSWSTAFSNVKVGGNYQTDELDFFKFGDEDNYGFITNLEWLLDGVVQEGQYEIKAESRCKASGGPKDLT